ncbi:MAG: DUF4926 domain-containing protein [Cyanobacteria bacterium QS_8_64_29]|nr:MAG: DUF4926 domain-containing protein [Cyanobacteria bacterium QS_8_64_29]
MDAATPIEELETVVLLRDVTDYGLARGDIGAVVYCSSPAGPYEVEFVTGQGKTVSVLTLGRDEIRPMNGREILHARPLASQYHSRGLS